MKKLLLFLSLFVSIFPNGKIFAQKDKPCIPANVLLIADWSSGKPDAKKYEVDMNYELMPLFFNLTMDSASNWVGLIGPGRDGLIEIPISSALTEVGTAVGELIKRGEPDTLSILMHGLTIASRMFEEAHKKRNLNTGRDVYTNDVIIIMTNATYYMNSEVIDWAKILREDKNISIYAICVEENRYSCWYMRHLISDQTQIGYFSDTEKTTNAIKALSACP